MSFEETLTYARNRDRNDPLRKFRKFFYFPRLKNASVIYLCGNSLGLLSKNVQGAINQEMNDWKTLAIAGYTKAKKSLVVLSTPVQAPFIQNSWLFRRRSNGYEYTYG